MPGSDPLTTLLDGHIAVAETAGSPFYARLLELMRDDAAAGGPVRMALRFPSTSGDGDAAAAWPAVRELIASGRAELVEALAHPLRTTAPSRSKALVGALCLVAERTGLPLRLLELGASAGLNLRLDGFRYEPPRAARGVEPSPGHRALAPNASGQRRRPALCTGR